MAFVAMRLPKGAGGFELHGRAYLPDAAGYVEVEDGDVRDAERHGAVCIAAGPILDPEPVTEPDITEPELGLHDPEPDGD